MPAKKNKVNPATLEGEALLKETCRRIRLARSLWKAHRNKACRGEREKALELYQRLTAEQKKRVPEELRTWLNTEAKNTSVKAEKETGLTAKVRPAGGQ